jgi:hypothetical protein
MQVKELGGISDGVQAVVVFREAKKWSRAASRSRDCSHSVKQRVNRLRVL